jgi:hypothetical protein
MLGGTVLDLVSSINDFAVIMDEKMTFSEHVDVMVAFAMLRFIRKLSLEFRDPYTLKSLYTSLVRPKLEYASCVWNLFYDVHVDRVEQADMHDLPPYEDRCALLHLETLAKRRSIACVMLFIFDVLSGRVNSPNLLSVLNLIATQYQTQTNYFHQMSYGIHEPM